MDVKRIFREIYEALIVSKCPACGEIVRRSGELCCECREKYDVETATGCPFCGMTADVCVCNTRSLKPTVQLGRSMYSYLFYGEKLPVSRRIIFSLKQNADRNAEKFLAAELSERINALMEKTDQHPKDWCVTYPPRTRRSAAKYGFDHAKGLSRRIAKQTGMKFQRVFTHRGKSIQKQLAGKERIRNARRAFNIIESADVRRKKYIIIDDIITSGATVQRCQTLLLKNGASAAFPVSVAKSISPGAGYDAIYNVTHKHIETAEPEFFPYWN